MHIRNTFMDDNTYFVVQMTAFLLIMRPIAGGDFVQNRVLLCAKHLDMA